MIFSVLTAGTPQMGGGGGFLNMLLLFAPLILIMYFLIIRPQQKQARSHKDMIASLKRGDSVVTRGGIIGKITRVEETEITLEIAENVRIRLLKETVAHVRNRTEPVSTKNTKKKNDEAEKGQG